MNMFFVASGMVCCMVYMDMFIMASGMVCRAIAAVEQQNDLQNAAMSAGVTRTDLEEIMGQVSRMQQGMQGPQGPQGSQ